MIKSIFKFTLFYILFLFTGCDEINNIFSKDKDTTTTQSSITHKKTTPPLEYDFTFKDLETQSSLLHVTDDFYDFRNIKQPIVMVAFLSSWAPPCRGEIPHLSQLQTKYKDKLFILGSLLYEDKNPDEFKKFIASQKAYFYISNDYQQNMNFASFMAHKLKIPQKFPVPLMVIFVQGKYFTHYEGAIPQEMIDSDIEQILNKLEE